MGILGRIVYIVLKDAASLTYRDIMRRKLVTPFIVFATFLISFIISRLLAYAFPSLNLIIGRYHIHHFYYGIALMAAAGWIALISDRQRLKLFAALLLGTGLGIIVDEAGLLLTCTSPLYQECNYHARIAIDVFTMLAAAFFSVLYFLPLWRGFRKAFIRAARFVLFFLV